MIGEWKHSSLGEVLTLQRGFDLPHRRRRPGVVPIISSAGPTDTHDIAAVPGPGVVTGRYGTIGEVFFVENSFWPLNTTLYVRDFKGNDPLFISYLLRTIDFASYSGKSGVPGVNRNDLHGLMVTTPEPCEQRAISAVLSDVDALIDALDRLIAKRREVKLATTHQLLTCAVRLPGFTGKWRSHYLGSGIDLFSGQHVLARFCNSEGKGWPYLTGPADFPDGQIRRDSFTTKPATLCKAGDVLVTVKGSGSGALIQADGTYCISRQLMAIRVRDWDAQFIYYSLCHGGDRIKAASTGLIPGLSRGDILGQPIQIPPMDEQLAIVTTISDADAEINALERLRKKETAIKQGMLQQLLSGRTRIAQPETVA
jgi:type I restriction enzyme S subunit